MRTRIAALAALLAILLSTTPAPAVTKGGVPDAGEHPMVGQLVFYIPDALPSPYGADQPGGWFSCSGTLLSGTVVVTAGHCTFAIGLDSVSTTTEENRFTAEDGNGTGGNDVWFSLNEDDDHWDGWPLTFDGDGNLNFPTQQARYEARRDFLNGNPLWVRATSFPHPEYDERAFYIHDAGVIELDEAQPGPYATIPTADYLQKYAGRRNEHRFEVVGYGLQRAHPVFEIGGDTRLKAEPRLQPGQQPEKDVHPAVEQPGHRRHLLRRLGRADVRRHELAARRRRDVIRLQPELHRRRRGVSPRSARRPGVPRGPRHHAVTRRSPNRETGLMFRIVVDVVPRPYEGR
jgi:hypothetical protein